CIDRFTMEIKRQLDVLDQRLADNQFLCGDEYTIADIAIWPWYGALVSNQVYGAAEFIDAHTYKNVNRWTQEIAARDAVKRGRMVNRISGPLEDQLHERHDAGDFDTKTQDKIGG
ncbi:MAG: glutathione S-transferase C-terminal domain-containing protein, partial [Alphaproteobacteria bacterium]